MAMSDRKVFNTTTKNLRKHHNRWTRVVGPKEFPEIFGDTRPAIRAAIARREMVMVALGWEV